MRALSVILLQLLFLTWSVQSPIEVLSAQTTQVALVVLNTPLPGQVLQGDILIMGNTDVDGFAACEITFGYAGDVSDTWFLIQRSTLPIADGLLAHWDTSTITDGDYTLRLLLTLIDGNQVILTVPGLRVRNYSPIETDTPTPPPPSVTPVPGTPEPPTASPTVTLHPTATAVLPTPSPLPTNPATLSALEVGKTFATGAGIGVGSLALIGMYMGIRKLIRNRK